MATTTAALPQRSRGARIQRGLQPYLYLVPAFLVMAIITFYPLFFQVWMSFHDFGQINFRVRNPVPAGVHRPRQLRPDRHVASSQIPNFEFVRLVLFNLWWALSNVVVHVVIGVADRGRPQHPGPAVPGHLPGPVHPAGRHPADHRGHGLAEHVRPDAGAVNLGLQGLGGHFRHLGRATPPSISTGCASRTTPSRGIPLPLAFFAMITANTWLGWPLNSVVATGALQSIPGELYEAAEMDGASPWQKFKNVTVPFLRPAMLPYAIYGFVITFNLFFLPFFMTQGEPFGRTEILVTQAYRLAVRAAPVRRGGGVLRLPVLPAAGRDARHQPAGESDEELCRLTADPRRRPTDDRPCHDRHDPIAC